MNKKQSMIHSTKRKPLNNISSVLFLLRETKSSHLEDCGILEYSILYTYLYNSS